MEDAMRSLARNTVSEDLALFATSVIIQIRSGGNLADMMERLAAVIRERQRLARRVRVLTSQTQFSKRVLLAMPFLVFVLLNIINPTYMRTLYATSAGKFVGILAAVMLLLGWLAMNWLSKLAV
jgi:tight adherence protein B